MDRLGKQEQMPQIDRVYEKGGRWFMRFDDKSDGVELPRDMGRKMRLALIAEQHSKRNKRTYDAIHTFSTEKGINCHLTAFYAIGLFKIGEKMNDPQERCLVFPKEEFSYFQQSNELIAFVKKQIAGSLGLIQIGQTLDGEFCALHSLIAGVDSLERVVCFDKNGWRAEFRCYPFDDLILKAKGNRSWPFPWAAAPIDEIKRNPYAQKVRKRVRE